MAVVVVVVMIVVVGYTMGKLSAPPQALARPPTSSVKVEVEVNVKIRINLVRICGGLRYRGCVSYICINSSKGICYRTSEGVH